jgi:hypothetical protein
MNSRVRISTPESGTSGARFGFKNNLRKGLAMSSSRSHNLFSLLLTTQRRKTVVRGSCDVLFKN